jgi:hypothetical protein
MAALHGLQVQLHSSPHFSINITMCSRSSAPTTGQSSSGSFLGSFFGSNPLLQGCDHLRQQSHLYAPAAKDGGWDGDVMLRRAL